MPRQRGHVIRGAYYYGARGGLCIGFNAKFLARKFHAQIYIEIQHELQELEWEAGQ